MIASAFEFVSLRCPTLMRLMRHAGMMLLGMMMVLATGGAGCGNLSQEDLLFLSARPTRDDLALRPPGAEVDVATDRQQQTLGLACDEGDLRCEAERAAQLLNQLTFALLDLLEEISSLPPTVRAVGYRRFGPFTVGEAVQATYLLQQQRNGDGSTRFCLHGHAGADDRSGRDDATVPSCDDAGGGDESLLLLWDGAITVGVGDTSLRTSQGNMRLFGDRVAAISGDRSLGNELTFAFDHNETGSLVNIDVDQAAFEDGDERGPLRYRFASSADGSGSVVVVIERDLIGSGIAFDRSANEQLTLRSVWTVTQSGRAQGSLTGGDLDEPVVWQQCWAEAPVLTTTYLLTHDNVVSGDSNSCVLSEADLPAVP
jgi:hypothetical protein